MPAYVIVDVEITDQTIYDSYRQLSGPSVEKHGGRFIVRGGAITPLEGDWQPTRIVVIEFASVEAARQWYDSPDYREARDVRAGGANFRMIIVAGVEPPLPVAGLIGGP
jgi:uncharacterized protein (DUF1330 family)